MDNRSIEELKIIYDYNNMPEDKRKLLFNSCGIYGIFVDDTLRYIGETINPFIQRFDCHKQILELKEEPIYSYMRIYKYLNSCKKAGANISFLVLRQFDIGSIDQQSLNDLEHSYITKYADQLKQYCGVLNDYNYKQVHII